MKLWITALVAAAAFFGWYDFSHHGNVKGYFTLACFGVAIFISILIIRRNRRGSR